MRSDLAPPGDLDELRELLLAAEILTRRGERGPLARIVGARPRPAAVTVEAPPRLPDSGDEER